MQGQRLTRVITNYMVKHCHETVKVEDVGKEVWLMIKMLMMAENPALLK